MRSSLVRLAPCLCLLVALTGCKKEELIEEDAGLEQDAGPEAGAPDLEPLLLDGPFAPPDRAVILKDGPNKKDGLAKTDVTGTITPDFTSPAGPFGKVVVNKVAAIQYAQGQANLVKQACTTAAMPDVCAVKELIVQARQQGANLAITPEYGLGQDYLEPTPKIGSNPGTDPAWQSWTLAKTFSYQAKQLGMFIIINLVTGTSAAKYNTNVAFDPNGAVVATHYKFELFGGEGKSLQPGTSVSTSAFQTPLGKTGLLICADIYGSPTLLTNLIKTQGTRVVAMSSEWTTYNPTSYYFAPFAKKWGVYLIVSNNTDPQMPGYDGAIIRPDGTLIASVHKATPSVLLGEIPLP